MCICVNNCPGDFSHQPGVVWSVTLVSILTVFTCLMQTLYKWWQIIIIKGGSGEWPAWVKAQIKEQSTC